MRLFSDAQQFSLPARKVLPVAMSPAAASYAASFSASGSGSAYGSGSGYDAHVKASPLPAAATTPTSTLAQSQTVRSISLCHAPRKAGLRQSSGLSWSSQVCCLFSSEFESSSQICRLLEIFWV